MKPAALALLLLVPPASAADAPLPPGSPFGGDLSTTHNVTARVDTKPVRGVLSILTGGPQPSATLRALKASPTLARALAAEGVAPEDFFGRVVATAAGTKDPLLASYASRSAVWDAVLDVLDAEGAAFLDVEARRVVALLPTDPRLSPKVTLVPFLAVAGFADVTTSVAGDDWIFVADLPRIAGEGAESAPPREVALKAIRATGAVAWRALFLAGWGSGPAFTEKGPDVDALLVRTVLEGPPTLLLIPDEFYPLDVVFDEPETRAVARWSAALVALADPKRKEADRSEILSGTVAGDLWSRSAGAVGAVVTDTLIRKEGRAAYLKALAAGPRAVIALWLQTTKGTKLPQPTKAARRELERLLSGPAGAEKR